jgi:hypothetical protein
LGPISGSHQGQRPNGRTQRPNTWPHPNASLIVQIPLAPRAPLLRWAAARWSSAIGVLRMLHSCVPEGANTQGVFDVPYSGLCESPWSNGSGPSSQHLQYVSACDARAKKPVAINLAHVSDFVAERRDLADGRLKPLLSVQFAAQMVTGILPSVRREE